MKSRINLPRLAGVVALAFVAVLVFASTSVAQLLSLTKTQPLITFDSGGVAAYDGTTLSIDASALFVQFSPSLPFPVQILPATDGSGKKLTIRALVNSSGALTGGVPGHDLVITGNVTMPFGLGVADGVLLTGEVRAFGYRDSPGGIDELDFRFAITGGLLEMFFQGTNDLYVPVTMGSSSNFTGSFETSFQGGAQGAAGATPRTELPLITKTRPLILFDSGGGTAYTPGDLSIDSLALGILFDSAPTPISPATDGSGRKLTIRTKGLVGGVDGHDLVLTGRVTRPAGLGVADGELLTGEVIALEFRDSAPSDELYFRVRITGGQLGPGSIFDFFQGINDLYVPVAMGSTSTFAGSFATSFQGGAQGTAGATPAGDTGGAQLGRPPSVMVPADILAVAPDPLGANVMFDVSATDSNGLGLAVSCTHLSGALFALGGTVVTCSAKDSSGLQTTKTFTVTVVPPPPPTVTTSGHVVVEADGPRGATAFFSASATDFSNTSLDATCAPASGRFPLGDTLTPVTCTSEPDLFGQVGILELTVTVTVVDTTPPEFVCGEDIDARDIGACDIFGIQATGPDGASVEWDVRANDLVSGDVVVTCSPASGSLFAIRPTLVECDAKDAALNAATLTFTVTVEVVPPAPRDGCFIVNFREITYFNQRKVITSSDASIRRRNRIAGLFDPTLWPYQASGGIASTTSRGTLFRIYGFQPAQKGQRIPDANESFTSYPVLEDPDTKGYYIDTGGPARVIICPGQLHNYVLGGRKRNGHMDGSTRLPRSQRNVPGIMLTHNSQILWLPGHVKAEMDQLGLIHGNRGVIDYIGFQLQGNGSAPFREFVDVAALFPGDSETDRHAHFKWGFHTATNTNFETFAGCNYVDSAPGNDSVRLRDVWVQNRSMLQGYANSSWAPCGSLEPAVNQKVRANYEVPFNAIQLLPSVNTNTDTLRLFYGAISEIPERIRRAIQQEN